MQFWSYGLMHHSRVMVAKTSFHPTGTTSIQLLKETGCETLWANVGLGLLWILFGSSFGDDWPFISTVIVGPTTGKMSFLPNGGGESHSFWDLACHGTPPPWHSSFQTGDDPRHLYRWWLPHFDRDLCAFYRPLYCPGLFPQPCPRSTNTPLSFPFF
jgi:hypothetical protein